MPPKSKPLSVRLSPRLDEMVSAEAKRTRRSRGAVVESLAEEALRSRRFPGIAFRGADWDRRPWVVGTALDVWEIVAASRDFASQEEMVVETDLDASQIRLALAYHREFPEEIDGAIDEASRSVAELIEEFPTHEVLEPG